MTKTYASMTSLIAAAISLPIWVIFVCKCIVAFADDFNSAGILVWTGISFVLAIPFGGIIGFLVSPAIYYRCNLTGLRRYRRTILIHLALGIVIAVIFLFRFNIPPNIVTIVAIPILSAPMLGVPSLVGTLAYAYATSPARIIQPQSKEQAS